MILRHFGRCVVANNQRRASAPAEFVQSIVVDAEVVSDFVDNSGDDLIDDIIFGVSGVQMWVTENHDPIRQYPGVIESSFG